MALAAAIVVSLLAVTAAGGSGVQTPKRGGTVYMPGGPEPACLTPYIMACASGLMVTFMDFLPRAVLPGAYEVRPDLTWKAQLVSRVDVSAKRLLTLTYHIRPDAHWSDGVPVSAGDFLFTYRTLLEHKAQLMHEDRTVVQMIRSVRALDAKTVRVVLPLDMTEWRAYLFSTILPRHVLRGEDYLSVWRERIENPKTGEPIGSGAFLVSGWERGKQLVLVRNPRYWGPHAAYVKRVALRFGLEGAPAAWLASGAVDVAYGAPGYETGLGPEAIPSLEAVPGVRVLSGPAPTGDVIDINVSRGGNRLLGERFVRRALAYGVHRQAIVRRLFEATLPKQQVSDSVVYLNSSPYYQANWGRYRYRPAEARRLLRKGGCVRGTDGIFVCDGERLSLRFVTRADVPSRVTTLQLVERQLRKAGVEVVPEYASGEVAFNEIWLSGKFDLLEVAATYLDPPDLFALSPLPCQDPRLPLDWTTYCQRLDPAELSRANYRLVGRERARAVNEVDAALAEEVPFLPLYWKPAIAASAASLRGYVLHPFDPFWRAEEWWLDRER